MYAAANRIEQGIRALFAFATPLDLGLAKQYLSGKELDAFLKMSRADQLHSLNVLRNVLSQQEPQGGSEKVCRAQAKRQSFSTHEQRGLHKQFTPSALAKAALLHDVGKSRYHLAIWQKTIAVLVKRLMPSLADRLGREEILNIWRAAFVLRSHHARWSVEILQDCGSDEVALWLVGHHQADLSDLEKHPLAELLLRLQRADDAC